LILATSTTSEWFALVKGSTVNSEVFWIFLEFFHKLIQLEIEETKENPTIIVDNWSVHNSQISKKLAASLDLDLKFLPPYCPEVAPVEQAFRAIKMKIWAKHNQESINFSKEAGMVLIIRTVRELKPHTWLTIWRDVIREWRSAVTQLRSVSM
jgi:transposase